MTLSDHLRQLADLVDGLEAAGVEIEGVSPAFDEADGRVTLTVSLADADTSVLLEEVERGPVVAERDEVTDTTAGSEGANRSTSESSEPPDDGEAVEATETETEDPASADSPGDQDTGRTFPCEHPDCDSVFGTEHGMKIHYGRMHDDEAGGRDDEDAESGGGTPPEDPAATDDGQPLAEVPPVAGIEAVEVKAAVEAADTLHEVATALDLDREQTRDLLAGLDLLELVHGRVATKGSRDRRKAEIADRLRENLDREPAD